MGDLRSWEGDAYSLAWLAVPLDVSQVGPHGKTQEGTRSKEKSSGGVYSPLHKTVLTTSYNV